MLPIDPTIQRVAAGCEDLLLTVRDIVVTVQSTFTAAYLMTGGGPYYATLFMPLLIYEEAFDRFRFGLGSAMMIVMFLSTGLLLYLVFVTMGRRRGS